MKIDFTALKYDEYELFLPSPVFSDLLINRTIVAGDVRHEVMTIKCDLDKPFFTHVETTGDFLLVEKEVWQGNLIEIPYTITASRYDLGTFLEGELIFTYLGGETVVPINVDVILADEDSDHEPRVKTNKAPKVKESDVAYYSVQRAKKAFNIDEAATIMVMNHQKYPITVDLVSLDPCLELSHEHLTIQDLGIIQASLKQKWWSRHISKKYYKQPVTNTQIKLTINYELGKEDLILPIQFTTYGIALGENNINSDRDYKKVLLQGQMHYNKFILKEDTSALNEAIGAIEAAMAYHGTDMDLWLFYLLLLTEGGRVEEVTRHVNALMGYSNFYLDDHNEAFIEIINVLDQWLKGDYVGPIVSAWPKTGYRELYRLRIFAKETVGFSDYETLYNRGFRSTHLYAHVASQMGAKPFVPSQPSVFYKALLMWAINKDAMSDLWLAYLEKMQYQVASGQLINGRTAKQLYSMHPSDGTLRLLVAVLIDENSRTANDHVIYLEALKQGIFSRPLELLYIRTSYLNRLPIIFDYIHLHGVIGNLDHGVITYLLASYLKDDLTDKSPHTLMMRHYREVLGQINQREFDEDELALIAYEVNYKISHHQWHSLVGEYENLNLSLVGQLDETLLETLLEEGVEALGFDWFYHKLSPATIIDLLDQETGQSYVTWLLQQGYLDDFVQIHESGHLSAYEASQVAWSIRLMDGGHPYGQEIGSQLYKKGSRDRGLLVAYQKVFVGTMHEMITFYKVLAEAGLCEEAFAKYILYKGMLTRQLVEEVLKVYIAYRKHFKDSLVEHYMNHYFAAVILIEEAYGFEGLMPIFEEDMSLSLEASDHVHPVSLALLRLYQLYDDENDMICRNLIKNAVKNGIIFPWFASMAKQYIQKGTMRKVAFFAYHSQPWIDVKIYYRCEDQDTFTPLSMKHVFFGFYIGYVMAFYKDQIQYYYEETGVDGRRDITESGIYIHDVFTQPKGVSSNFDVVNTLIMSEELDDEESMVTVIKDHIEHRTYIKNEMTML